MKYLSSIHKWVSYLPLSWFILFISFVCGVSIKLGRIPTYNNPDPKEIGFGIPQFFILCLYISTIVSIIPWLILTMIIIVISKKHIKIINIFIFLLFYILIFVTGRMNPWGLYDWLTD